ncbi:hypothetical protein JL722_8368 [Aureococcus anophagefferens]|nr:hypothetical protein JL722_8368 [Aureococcus anophagefferens]
MRDRSVTQGVTVARPLLEKEDAHVAHARRALLQGLDAVLVHAGRLRNELLPLLRDVYGAGARARAALDSTRDDDDDAPDGALDRFFATGAFTYAVDAPPGEALRLASSGLRKYKPIQRLDDLVAGSAAPSRAAPSKPKADVVRVRVTATFVPPPKAA